jgi:cytochrome c
MQCHNLEMPPFTSADEVAPPMMAVVFHIKSSLEGANPAETKSKFIEFIQEYVIHPSVEKSFCDKESLEKYGLMPSQRKNLSDDELTVIANYAYEHYDRHKFLNILQQQSNLKALPKGEQLAHQHHCLTCHSKNEKKVGPSFKEIALRYSDQSVIIRSITEGSQGKWEGIKATMPANKKLTSKELKQLSEWIQTL